MPDNFAFAYIDKVATIALPLAADLASIPPKGREKLKKLLHVINWMRHFGLV